MDIVIIGTGNTATILGKKLKAAGHYIVQVFGRDAKAASQLAYELGTESTNYWSVVNKEAQMYIVAVSDIAIADIIMHLQLPHKTVVHTAAAVSKSVLEKVSEHYGVFYPLQTLKKEAAYLPDIPIIIDASDEKTIADLETLAHSISDNVLMADDNKRLKLHLAAVFCNNFVNHIYTLMQEYCQQEDIDFTLLLPLIQETTHRIENLSPAAAQTGPAIRNDQSTIQRHLAILETYPKLKEFYELFTQSIYRLS